MCDSSRTEDTDRQSARDWLNDSGCQKIGSGDPSERTRSAYTSTYIRDSCGDNSLLCARTFVSDLDDHEQKQVY